MFEKFIPVEVILLAIETSCDDTAAAVLEGGRRVLSSLVSSQDEVHRKYGGVVPELASRRHMENIVPVVRGALKEAGVDFDELGGIAVTRGPGLIGSLFVGLATAKAIAFARGIPFVGVNHLMGHLLAIFLEREVPFPFIGMVVSGGHTSLFLVEHFLRFRSLGVTRDDAVGEAFDKVAKALGLGYPGGRIIEELATRGDPHAIAFPRPYLEGSFDFSFSGLKTAVINYIRSHRIGEDEVPHVAASFQEAVVDVLVKKALWASARFGVGRVVVSGGVASNGRLRERFLEEGRKGGIEVLFPSPRFCTDNAAMIGVAGYHLLKAGRRDPLDLNATSRWPLGREDGP